REGRLGRLKVRRRLRRDERQDDGLLDGVHVHHLDEVVGGQRLAEIERADVGVNVDVLVLRLVGGVGETGGERAGCRGKELAACTHEGSPRGASLVVLAGDSATVKTCSGRWQAETAKALLSSVRLVFSCWAGVQSQTGSAEFVPRRKPCF